MDVSKRLPIALLLCLALQASIAYGWKTCDFHNTHSSYFVYTNYVSDGKAHNYTWTFGRHACGEPGNRCCAATVDKLIFYVSPTCQNTTAYGTVHYSSGGSSPPLQGIPRGQGENTMNFKNIHLNYGNINGSTFTLTLTEPGCIMLPEFCPQDGIHSSVPTGCSFIFADSGLHCCPSAAESPVSPPSPTPIPISPSPKAPTPPQPPSPHVVPAACNCNSSAGMTPFSFAEDATIIAPYSKKLGKVTVNAYVFNFVIGSGKGEGRYSINATKAEFRLTPRARGVVVGALVNDESRSSSWSKVYPAIKNGVTEDTVWYKVPIELKSRGIPPLTPTTAYSVTLFVNADTPLEDLIPAVGDGKDILYNIFSEGSVDVRKGIPFCPAGYAHIPSA